MVRHRPSDVIKTLLFIPIRDNEGHPFGRAQWRGLEARLRSFGGFTRLADVAGEWEWAGRVYRDRSRQYLVTLRSWGELSAWLVIVEDARTAFRQEALYIEVAGIPEIWRPEEKGR